jgi:hypothetical protein
MRLGDHNRPSGDAPPATSRLRLAVHPDRPERLAVIRPDGSAAPWFAYAYDETREEALAKLAGAGIEVTVDDDAVVRLG